MQLQTLLFSFYYHVSQKCFVFFYNLKQYSYNLKQLELMFIIFGTYYPENHSF